MATLMNIKGVHVPKTKQGIAKFQLLLQAAEKLFATHSFFEISVSDISKEAHTAVGTFYIYFDGKKDIYRYLVEHYKGQIKHILSESIKNCTTRVQMEREGIKCFVRYAVDNPTIYHIVWGSLAVEKEMFEDYYVSFAKSYARALAGSENQLKVEDVTTTAYMLMGITNFLGLRAIFEQMDETQIDEALDNTVMPILEKGMFR